MESTADRPSAGQAYPVTADQLEVLTAIVDAGSFTAAARALGRTQGAVSYHVARLETQLGIALFDRSGRRPRLTDEGRAIVRHARDVLADLARLREVAGALRSGVEAQLSLAVDSLFPPRRLAALLRELDARFPGLDVALHGGVWEEPVERVRAGLAHLAIGPASLARELRAQPCARVEFVPVAAPTHPLARIVGNVGAAEFSQHRRLLLMTGQPLVHEPSADRTRVWRLSDSALRHGLLLEGVGWSRLPAAEVEDDLAAGRLVRLVTDAWLGADSVQLAVISDPTRPLGPAARWAASHVASHVADGSSHPGGSA